MAFTVPKSARESLRYLLTMPDNDFDAVLTAMERMPVMIETKDAERYRIEHAVDLPADAFKHALQAGLSLAYGRSSTRLANDEFIEQVLATADEWLGEKLTAENAARLRARLDALLSLSTLNAGAKAAELVFETTRHMTGARIITDVRPIFAQDVSQQPQTTLIIHTLKLDYHEGHGKDSFGTFYTSVDWEDLGVLRAAIDRAIAKEESLRSMLGSAGIGVVGLSHKTSESEASLKSERE
jgi:hypothetical protein